MPAPAAPYLETREEDGVLVFTINAARVEGEDVAEALRHEMLAALANTGSRRVVVDFQHTRYISSAAFRPLLSLRRNLQESGGRLLICGLTPLVGDIFYTTRMISPDGSFTPMFEMEPTAAAAVARLRGSAGGGALGGTSR